MLCGVCPHLEHRPSPEPSFFGDVDVFGVAFREFQPGWHHAALVFSVIGEPGLRLLHLGGNYDFRNDPIEEGYQIVPCPDFTPDELDLLSVQASRLWKQTGKDIPYNFDYDGTQAFNIDLSFLSEGGRGLTCATFVLAFFNLYGYRIVDVPSWQFRPEDVRWQQLMFRHLEAQLGPEHAARMKANIGTAARFKPEEVVACVNRFVGEPIIFERGKRLGRMFMMELHANEGAQRLVMPEAG